MSSPLLKRSRSCPPWVGSYEEDGGGSGAGLRKLCTAAGPAPDRRAIKQGDEGAITVTHE
ncbi:hypothetical protein Misp02_71430 [Microtetraspora sp. NBRC 16547]|nr:hypothetical protein Misp02_71430 [Microtetraspora sp. NBRC 16547]